MSIVPSDYGLLHGATIT